MIDDKLKPFGDAAALGVGGTAFTLAQFTAMASTATVWLTFAGALISSVWFVSRALDSRLAKALLWRFFRFDIEAWFTANRAGRVGDDG
jgi:hypothetical protein